MIWFVDVSWFFNVNFTLKSHLSNIRILTKLYTHVCDQNILINVDSHGNCFSHLGVTALICKKTTWKISCLCQTSTLLGALASNIHRCLLHMCRLSWIFIMALIFCGKKTEVWAHFYENASFERRVYQTLILVILDKSLCISRFLHELILNIE